MAHGRGTARLFALSLIGCGVLVTSLIPRPASGARIEDFVDHRLDPDGATLLGGSAWGEEWSGFRSVTLSVWTSAEGRRWLRVVIYPESYLYAYIRLDTDGDRAADAVVVLKGQGMEWPDGACVLFGGGIGRHEGRVVVSGDPDVVADGFVACHVPLAALPQASGPIAWRVWAGNQLYLDECSVTEAACAPPYMDRAPNVGWYV